MTARDPLTGWDSANAVDMEDIQFGAAQPIIIEMMKQSTFETRRDAMNTTMTGTPVDDELRTFGDPATSDPTMRTMTAQTGQIDAMSVWEGIRSIKVSIPLPALILGAFALYYAGSRSRR